MNMQEKDLAETQPSQVTTKSAPIARRKRNKTWVLWVLFGILSLAVTAALGTIGGYQTAVQQNDARVATQNAQSILEQYALGVKEMEAGQYDLARQRFEYVLARDPAFPGATDKLAEVVQVLYATATPSPLPPTPTLTPTRDLRPVADLLAQAKSDFSQGDWNKVIDTLLSLRQADANYQMVEVDRMLYLTLRNRGVDKILKQSDLEGGIYDLALAERFGPLDVEADNDRNLARLYMIGSSFWEAYPEQAVYYFRQVAAAAPYLRDASGWTAQERYRGALMQYGDQLAKNGDWCNAQTQYELADSIRPEGSLEATAVYAAEQCAPPTQTPLPFTVTSTLTPTLMATWTPTWTPFVSPTPTPTSVILPTTEIPPSPAVSPTLTNTPIPSVTPTETSTPVVTSPPIPSETPTPLATVPPIPSDTPTPTNTVPPAPSSTPSPTTEAAPAGGGTSTTPSATPEPGATQNSY